MMYDYVPYLQIIPALFWLECKAIVACEYWQYLLLVVGLRMLSHFKWTCSQLGPMFVYKNYLT